MPIIDEDKFNLSLANVFDELYMKWLQAMNQPRKIHSRFRGLTPLGLVGILGNELESTDD